MREAINGGVWDIQILWGARGHAILFCAKLIFLLGVESRMKKKEYRNNK